MNKNSCSRYFLLTALLLMLGGCLTVTDTQTLVEASTSGSFVNRRLAVLPVKAQTSLSPDSVLPIRTELNRQLGGAIQKKLASSAVADVTTVTNRLNEGDGLNTLEKLVETYEITGIVDRKGAAALGQFLNADFLVFSRLKAEKMDVTFLSKGTGTSLEIMIVSTATGKIAWGGIGEWKRGGIWGTGGANPKEVADQLATLALTSLPQATGQYHDLSQLESPQEFTAPESTTKKRKKRRKNR